jgi:hypothetical protein
VKPSLLLLVLFFAGVFQAILEPASRASTRPSPAAAAEHADQSAVPPPVQNTLSIPGPLRSFLRMAGLSQEIPPADVLPLLSHNVVLQGYQLGTSTEYLILLRRYVSQAKELSALAGQNGRIHVNGCKDAEALLQVLGYRIRGECGQSGMTLITAEPQRAFLTIDSGFPLVDLEEAMQHDAPFAFGYQGTNVPVLFAPADWSGVITGKEQEKRDCLDSLLYEQGLVRLYWALSRIEPETRMELKKDIGLAKLLPLAPILDLYGNLICIREGAVVVPGGRNSTKEWEEMVGASVKAPAQFIPMLLMKDHGWLAAYYDAMARASQRQQEHFAEHQRMKRFYAAFRSPGGSAEVGKRVAFRAAPGLMVLVARMQWDANGDPYVPGSLQAWNEILPSKIDPKLFHTFGKHPTLLHNADQLAEAMFVSSRVEAGNGPLQAYLYLSELDHRRAPGKQLNNAAVILLAKKYVDYSDQYLIFSEFPELSDESITRFMTIADALSKVSDSTARGNAMGLFQANVGLWQILARQGEIDRAHLNSSWQEMIQPFSTGTTDAQFVTAARTSLGKVFAAATGKANVSQDELIELIAGTPQMTAEGQQVHKEMANRIRLVLEDQRLVSIDTVFALDEGLRNPPQAAARRDELATMAGELREFEMPQPIFTNSERSRWAAGIYNNHHTDLQMKTDLAKVMRSSESPKQTEAARGQLASFLRDTLVGMNYAYYEPPGSQVLHNNPLFVRSHDFSGETVMGIEHLWQASRLFGQGSPAGGGAHLIGSLADLPYVLAQTEEEFLAPDHVQALIWQQFAPGVLSSAVVPRWWNVSAKELHAVSLYQKAGDELLTASSKDEQLGGKVVAVLSDRMFPERRAWLEEEIRTGKTEELLEEISPADSFYLTAEFREKYPGELAKASPAGEELETLLKQDAEEVNWERLSHDFGVSHPVFVQTYALELINLKPFPALGGYYSRLMSECWDSGNLYWARLADELGYAPVQLNSIVPELTGRMVQKIFASEIDDLPATVRALRETGEEFRHRKVAMQTGSAAPQN